MTYEDAVTARLRYSMNTSQPQALSQTSEGAQRFHEKRLRRLGMRAGDMQPAAPAPIARVSATAASRVAKAEWEAEEDKKDAELEVWIAGLGLNLPASKAGDAS